MEVLRKEQNETVWIIHIALQGSLRIKIQGFSTCYKFNPNEPKSLNAARRRAGKVCTFGTVKNTFMSGERKIHVTVLPGTIFLRFRLLSPFL